MDGHGVYARNEKLEKSVAEIKKALSKSVLF